MAPPAATPSRIRSTRRLGIVVALLAGATVLGAGVLRGVAGDTRPVTAVGPSAGPSTAGPSAGPTPAGPSAEPSSAPPSPSAVASPTSSTPPPSPGPVPSASPTPDRRTAARLQATLDIVRRQLGIPGVEATILFPDGSSWTGVSGYADVATRTHVTKDTAFAIASVSKTFTSALILGLVDEGRIRLTDPAVSLLPPLRLKIDRRITVAMLLNHTSGLSDYFLNPKIDGPLQKRPSASWTVDQVLRYVRKPLSPPGKAWHYANTNYLLLGLIAEHVTGEPYAELVRTRLLEPAGLESTWVQAGEEARAPLAHGYRLPGTSRTVKPVDLDDGSGIAPFRSVITAAGGAGSIAATSDDLARWAHALYEGRVLGPSGSARLFQGFSPTTAYLPGVTYGYGVQALSIDGHPSLGHSGRLLGFRSAMRHFPVDGLTIAVLTNQSRADPGVIVRRLLAIALPTAPACPACPSAR
ncbi:MAG TPA: serine hydrolase domain-containing protein [Candidatus Limnocylindrales bacterium]|nr:serine hydrolase domain-containing protein [Candidatus Limnocylindrales bacterium]